MKNRLALAALLLCALPASALSPVVEWRFENGMRVLVLEDHKLPTVMFTVMFKGAGANAEPVAKAGLAAVTADLMTEGAGSLSSKELNEKVEFMGASLSAWADWDRTSVSARALNRDFDAILGLFADVVMRPTFKQEEVERVKQRTLSSIVQALDDPNGLSANAFQRFLYGPHRYGLPVIGVEKTVRTITRDDVVAFHAQMLRADNAVLIVAGDVEQKRLQEALQKTFGSFRPGTPPPAPPLPEPVPRDARILLLDKPDLTQAKITFGHVGIPREHPDYYPAAIMNGVLGGTGFMSRLMQVVRSKMGLTYGIRSGFDARKTGGTFNITISTRTELAATAIKATIAEIERLQSTPIPAKELSDVETYLVGAFQLAMETPEARANALLTADLFNQGLEYLETHPAKIRAVTAKDAARAAQSLLNPAILRFVVVGNAAQLEEQLRAIGTVEIRPHARWADDGAL